MDCDLGCCGARGDVGVNFLHRGHGESKIRFKALLGPKRLDCSYSKAIKLRNPTKLRPIYWTEVFHHSSPDFPIPIAFEWKAEGSNRDRGSTAVTKRLPAAIMIRTEKRKIGISQTPGKTHETTIERRDDGYASTGTHRMSISRFYGAARNFIFFLNGP